MNPTSLPKRLSNPVTVPPIKCQGIKTRLVDFILTNIRWDGSGRWIEPFLGSGVVLFNVQPQRARVGDSNPHIIKLYQRIYQGQITPQTVKEYLLEEGSQLAKQGEAHYYAIRQRFNDSGDSLDFLFLNRSCFNGVMRFNSKGRFNVPFCHKPDRFRQPYITKIVNQVKTIRDIMRGKDWEFFAGDWRDSLQDVESEDFVYLDPPYIGRHTDYYNRWTDKDAAELATAAQSLLCGVVVSMWKQNKYRANHHIADHWGGMIERTTAHFYHVGPTEELRHHMEESLLIKPGWEADSQDDDLAVQFSQPRLFNDFGSS